MIKFILFLFIKEILIWKFKTINIEVSVKILVFIYVIFKLILICKLLSPFHM